MGSYTLYTVTNNAFYYIERCYDHDDNDGDDDEKYIFKTLHKKREEKQKKVDKALFNDDNYYHCANVYQVYTCDYVDTFTFL